MYAMYAMYVTKSCQEKMRIVMVNLWKTYPELHGKSLIEEQCKFYNKVGFWFNVHNVHLK